MQNAETFGQHQYGRLSEAPYQILVVCTANVCRSVMAEHLMRSALRSAGLDGRIEVRSAGTQVVIPPWDPEPERHLVSRGAVELLRRRGITVETHARTRVDPQLLDASELVLVMERVHLQDIVNLWPPAAPKTFLLKEAALLAERSPLEAVDLPSRVAELDSRRPSPKWVLELDRSIDVEDPVGGEPEFFEACAADIESAIDTLIERLFSSWDLSADAVAP